jgi:hypothetical protein
MTTVNLNSNKSLEELTNYHQSLLEQYSSGVHIAPPSAADLKIVAFNGYYNLVGDGTVIKAGAFLSIDTNLIVFKDQKPFYNLVVILSTDGVHSKRYSLPGEHVTFADNVLTLTIPNVSAENTILQVNFSNTDDASGITSTFSGTFNQPELPSVTISGSTYNNPIPIHMYNGLYHEKRDLVINKEKKEVMTNVMQIGPNNELQFDYGDNSGVLQQVPAYVYNLNMYYFSFSKNGVTYKIIMGTSSGGGLVCNNITVAPNSTKPTARSLQTITSTKNDLDLNGTNVNAEQLAQFGGYYQLSSASSPNPLSGYAFLSIEGIYTVSGAGESPEYTVKIGLSLNGQHSSVIPFDDKMTFDPTTNTLTIPNELDSGKTFATIIFNRSYQPDGNFGTLVDIEMKMGGNTITGINRLNPVPLMAFAGATMTNTNGDSLDIVSNSEIVYNKIQMHNIIYVPLMYILAYNYLPVNNQPNPNSYVYSFGTDGLSGNCCIVTHKNVISSVYAILPKKTK